MLGGELAGGRPVKRRIFVLRHSPRENADYHGSALRAEGASAFGLHLRVSSRLLQVRCGPMRFLLDTSIVIPAEPTSSSNIEPGTPIAVALLRALEEGAHRVYLHPESVVELGRDKNSSRRNLRRILLNKYLTLPSPPGMSKRLNALLGEVVAGTHNAADRALLEAVEGDAVDYLVTEDQDLMKAASRVGLSKRVVTPADAMGAVRRLFPTAPAPPPAVRKILAHELDNAADIFSSFRHDYPGFDAWLQKCKRDHRPGWVIEAPGRELAGFCIVKEEDGPPYGLRGRALKICSFKISDSFRGYRFGELLLKTIFSYAFANKYEQLYVTVFEKYIDLVRLFEDFGFEALAQRSDYGELVLAKPLVYSEESYNAMSPLAFHVRFGPFYTKLEDTELFVVPIQPKYDRFLFPDLEAQGQLLPGQQAFGNSIRKAYLCNAATRKIKPGNVLLFYRSADQRAVRCGGVVEEVLVSRRPEEIARFVGNRTVYSYDEIVKMSVRPVLAILFRQAKEFRRPIRLRDLRSHGAITGVPRSIVRVRKEGLNWLRGLMAS